MLDPGSVFHHRTIGVVIVVIGLAEYYGVQPLLAPAGTVFLGLYGLTLPVTAPEDVTHQVFSALALAGGLFEGWRRFNGWNDGLVVSRALLVLASVLLLFHRHSHHQTTFVTVHHTLFALALVALAATYHQAKARAITIIAAGFIMVSFLID